MLSFMVFLILCFAAAALGSAFTARGLKAWYPSIRKPSWNPPDKVFAPVWTVLYALMAVAGWLAWERSPAQGRHLPMALFAVQLALNAGWSAVFFGLHRPGWAFVELVLLWISVIATTASFWMVSWVAGALFLPYCAWVSFAAVLNFIVWRLNRAR